MSAAAADAGVTDVDIAIVGGGLVGTPLALALDAAGWRVALIERRDGAPDVPDDPLDQRCTALSAGSVDWLDAHALWAPLAADASPIRRVHVSHRGRFGATRLTADEQGVDALGHVVENRRVLAALEGRLAASGVHRLVGRAVGSIESGAASTCVHHVPLDDRGDRDRSGGRSGPSGSGDASDRAATLHARLVVGVDGTESAVRRSLGIGVRRHDYRQSAVLGTLRLERDHGHVAHERFTDGGPLALLPRPGGIVSFVECVTPEDGERVAALDDAAFLARLQSRFGRRLGRFVATGPRTVQALVRVEAERQVGDRAVLLGNAVRLLHPIAGQGYNLALRDVAALVEALGRRAVNDVPAGVRVDDADIGVRGGDGAVDPGAPALLEAFAASRRADQRRVVALTDTLARTFRGHNAALSHLRALGLIGLDTVAPLRRRFARAAMGTGG